MARKIFSDASVSDSAPGDDLLQRSRQCIVLAIANELDIPVKLIGTGEKLEDLRPFDPEDFARALLAD